VQRQVRLGQQQHAGDAAAGFETMKQLSHRLQTDAVHRLPAQRAQFVGHAEQAALAGAAREVGRQVQSVHGAGDGERLTAALNASAAQGNPPRGRR
jgi:hypothetical protein